MLVYSLLNRKSNLKISIKNNINITHQFVYQLECEEIMFWYVKNGKKHEIENSSGVREFLESVRLDRNVGYFIEIRCQEVERSLEDDIGGRAAKGEAYSREELLEIFRQLLAGAIFLRDQSLLKTYHWSVNPRNVMIVQDSYKHYNYWTQHTSEGDARYYAPEIRSLSTTGVHDLTTQEEEDLEAMSTYALGLSIARCAHCALPEQQFFDLLSSGCLPNADADIDTLIAAMLEQDPRHRANYLQVWERLQSLQSKPCWEYVRVFRDNFAELFEMLRAGALELGEIVLAENQVYYLAEDRNFHRQNMPELFLYTLGDASNVSNDDFRRTDFARIFRAVENV